jgi:tetratricopeptide (TPR) repeat protein
LAICQGLPIWKQLQAGEPNNTEYASQVALCELHTGNREGALEQATEIITQHPDDMRTLEVAIAAAELSDHPADAIDPMRKLMDMQTTEAERERVRVRLIRLLIHLFNTDPAQYGLEEAIKLAQERIDAYPDSADSHLLMGELCTMDAQLDKSSSILIMSLRN